MKSKTVILSRILIRRSRTVAERLRHVAIVENAVRAALIFRSSAPRAIICSFTLRVRNDSSASISNVDRVYLGIWALAPHE